MVSVKEKKRFSTGRARNPEAFVEVTRPEQLVKILHRLIRAGADRRISAILARLHPADIAHILTFLPIPESRQLIRILFRLRKAAATISELPSGMVHEILEGIEPDIMAEFVRRLPPDDAADILQELPPDELRAVLQILHIDEVNELKALLAYSDDTAGAIMNPDFFALDSQLTVDEAIQKIRDAGDLLESVFYIYVVDETNRLLGTVSMREILLAPGTRILSDALRTNPVMVRVDMSEDKVAEIIAKYDLLAVPVVDEREQLIGVITVDDVIDVIQDAATEGLYRMAALDEEDRVFSSPARSVALRLPWLSLNFLTALLAALTVGLFEDLITEVVALAAMMPIVAGMGGNSGTQTLTVMIRGLALGEIRSLNVRKAVAKEFAVGLTNGICIGLMGGIFAWLWKGEWWLGVLLGIAIVVNLCIAALGGATIPLILRRFKLDPALGSSIFLTTLTDVFGFFCFLGLAAWLLPLIGVI